MLANTCYIGIGRFRSQQNIIRPVPAIVSREIFDLVQPQLKRNLTRKPDAKRINLLRGLIKCRLCSRSYVCIPRSGKLYYCCSGQIQAGRKESTSEKCKAAQIPANMLEQVFWQTCKDILLRLEEILARINQNSQRSLYSEDTKDILNELADIKRKRQNIYDYYREGLIPQDEFDHELRTYDKSSRLLEQRLKMLQNQAEQYQNERELDKMVKDYLNAWSQDAAAIEAQNDREAMRNLIQMLVQQITITTTGTGRKKGYELRGQLRFGKTILQGKDRIPASEAVYKAFLMD
jgi:hypothetical protein